jgi:hypothetical protein
MIAALAVILKVLLQVIRKEKEPEHCEHNKEFDDDYDPERTSPGHISEAIPVEIIYPCENVTSHNPRCLVTQI